MHNGLIYDFVNKMSSSEQSSSSESDNDSIPDTLGVLIFAGTNFREFFSPYIRGYLFSRMSFYSTFAGTNFREWVL